MLSPRSPSSGTPTGRHPWDTTAVTRAAGPSTTPTAPSVNQRVVEQQSVAAPVPGRRGHARRRRSSCGAASASWSTRTSGSQREGSRQQDQRARRRPPSAAAPSASRTGRTASPTSQTANIVSAESLLDLPSSPPSTDAAVRADQHLRSEQLARRARRCPRARPACAAVDIDHEQVGRGTADLEQVADALAQRVGGERVLREGGCGGHAGTSLSRPDRAACRARPSRHPGRCGSAPRPCRRPGNSSSARTSR